MQKTIVRENTIQAIRMCELTGLSGTAEALKKILEEAFHKEKPRKKSRVPRSVKEKRIKDKKQNSEVKNSRKKIDKNDF